MLSRICVKNIGKNCTEQQLKDLFSQRGEVTDVKIVKNKNNGLSRNFAFIGFRTDLQAQDAIRYFNNTFIGLSRIAVEMAKKLDDPTLKEKRGKHNKKLPSATSSTSSTAAGKQPNPPSASPATSKKSLEKEVVIALDDKNNLSKNKKAFLEVVKKTSSTIEEKAAELTNAHPHPPPPPFQRTDETENDSEEDGTKDDEEDDDDSAIDLEDLLKQQSSDPKNPSKTTVIVDKKQSLQKMSDLDYLRSKMSKSLDEPEEEEEEEQSDSDEDDDNDDDKEVKEAEVKPQKQRKDSFGEKSTSDHSHHGATDHEEANDDHNVAADEDETHNRKRIHDTDPDSETDDNRLFIKNIPYSCTEDELKQLGEEFGKVSEVHIPLDATTRRNKGIAFITFLFPSDASKALNALHGTSFQGRVMYVNQAKKPKEKEIAVITVGKEGRPLSSFQQKKETERRKLLLEKEGWNASYVRSDAVVENLAERYNIAKSQLLDTELKGGDMAVRLAIAETQILQENHEFFASHGVNLDVLESFNSTNNKNVQRSTTTLLIKNLPPESDLEELESMFARYGVMNSFLVPKSKTIALVDFEQPSEARIAHKSLAYRRYKNSPLFLEWAPLGIISDPSAGKKEKQELLLVPGTTKAQPSSSSSAGSAALETTTATLPAVEEDDNLEEYSTLFVKNLNFSTTDEAFYEYLSNHLRLEGIRKAMIQKKQKGAVVLSQGYGFIEFRNNYFAEIALKKISQAAPLDSHKLEVKPSDKRISTVPSSFTLEELQKLQSKKLQPKLIVRNVAFQASKEEIRSLFTSFGLVKRVRIPKKMDGRHRGFAFVEFATTQEAINAMNALKNSHLYGRHLVIEWAKAGEDEEEEQEETTAARNSSNKVSSNRSVAAMAAIEGHAPKSIEKLRKRAREDERKIEIASKRPKRKSEEGDEMDIEGEGSMNELL